MKTKKRFNLYLFETTDNRHRQHALLKALLSTLHILQKQNTITN